LELAKGRKKEENSEFQKFLDEYSQKFINGVNVNVSDFTVLSKRDVDKLSKNEKKNAVRIYDKKTDLSVVNRFKYDIEKYKMLHEAMNNVVSGITPDMSEINKFMIIYKRLGNIKYDHAIVEELYSKYAKDNIDNTRNLVNGLMKGTCVCAGYSDILHVALNEVGIENQKVTGVATTAYHQWNQIKIDNVWYNTDLTGDAPALREDSFLNMVFCLRSDKDFKNDHTATTEVNKCDRAMGKMKLYSAYMVAKKFDKKKVTKRNIIGILKEKFSRLFKKKDVPMLDKPNEIKKEEINALKKFPWELTADEKEEAENKMKMASENVKKEEENIKDSNIVKDTEISQEK
jgi:hypothetical protein